MRYEFIQDIKVTVWQSTTFSVEADSYEEALKKAEQARNNDLCHCPGLVAEETETIFESVSLLPPEKNDGYSTREVYDEYRELLFENGKTNLENQSID